jgi:PAS domain S-box-containing protein
MTAEPNNEKRTAVFPCQAELIALFETLVNVMFSVKDLDGRYVEVNSAFVRRTGTRSKREVIGTKASDHFVEALANRYEEQDREVFETGEPLVDQLELIRGLNGDLGWYLTTKLPVANQADRSTLVGVVSVSRDLHAPSTENISLERLQHVVAHVRANLQSTIRASTMAEVAECSESQLERRMRKVFGLSATQYVLRVRVDAAAKLLIETNTPLAEIATTCGFYDQPNFTRRFARLTNATPAQFRSENRRNHLNRRCQPLSTTTEPPKNLDNRPYFSDMAQGWVRSRTRWPTGLGQRSAEARGSSRLASMGPRMDQTTMSTPASKKLAALSASAAGSLSVSKPRWIDRAISD